MGTFSEIGIGLSIVFGFLLLALAAELYYHLWWKKKVSRREIQSSQIITEHEYSNYVKELTQIFRWKKSPPHLPTAALGGESEVKGGGEEVNADDLLLKAFGGEEGVEAELMRLHNLAGPPRFLFTIKEESKEDLESEDGRKGSRTGSVMSDVVLTIDTPNFLSPLASPMSKSNLNPLNGVHHGLSGPAKCWNGNAAALGFMNPKTRSRSGEEETIELGIGEEDEGEEDEGHLSKMRQKK